MTPKNRAKEGILGSKWGGNWQLAKRHQGKKKTGRVVNRAQCTVRYPVGRLAMAEIIKYRRDGGYLISKAPLYHLRQEIVYNLSLQQQWRWQRSAVECLQVAAEEHLVINVAAGIQDTAHAG
ncbi:hypothetical protein HOY80DRAFT_1092260 [Tuber brumale]|nr:hypothetical protein HOY80DRAFT_1092260 [Tuber brumale]